MWYSVQEEQRAGKSASKDCCERTYAAVPEGKVKLLEDIIKMKLIGIIGAMEIEVASLKEMMTDVTIRTKASMEFNHGYLNGK